MPRQNEQRRPAVRPPAPEAKKSLTPEQERERRDQMQPQRITVCGTCQRPTPDVEFYMHDRKGLSARWLCAICADKFMISDEGRLTNQSDLSRKGLFRREYGRTKRFGFEKDLSELASAMASKKERY
jgi:hypothetical protein